MHHRPYPLPTGAPCRVKRFSFIHVVLACAVALAACGGSSAEEPADTSADTSTTTTESTTTTAAPTTTTEPLGPIAPLLGQEVEELPERPILALKIDNAPAARPQVGLNQADMVIEEYVEGISRFVALFHSTDSDPVGPIRSVRTTDIKLMASLHHPLFGFSGGNPGTVSLARSSPHFQLVHWDAPGLGDAYFRVSGRRNPHNLFTNTSTLFAVVGEEARIPEPLFAYREEGEPSGGETVTAVNIDMGHQINYTWDAVSGTWLRSQNGTPHVDEADVQIAPANVVVLETVYGRSSIDARTPEAVVTGEGKAYVFTDGKVIEGTWGRAEVTDRVVVRNAFGVEVELTPGRTWIALPKQGRTEILR